MPNIQLIKNDFKPHIDYNSDSETSSTDYYNHLENFSDDSLNNDIYNNKHDCHGNVSRNIHEKKLLRSYNSDSSFLNSSFNSLNDDNLTKNNINVNSNINTNNDCNYSNNSSNILTLKNTSNFNSNNFPNNYIDKFNDFIENKKNGLLLHTDNSRQFLEIKETYMDISLKNLIGIVGSLEDDIGK